MSENRRISWKNLLVVFGLQVLTVVVVVIIFRQGLPRLWAARWASLCFLAIGGFVVFYLGPHKRGFWALTWFAAWIHLGVFSLPMGGFRWFSESSFEQLRWFGFTGPQLHQGSTYFYYAFMAAPLIDYVRLLLNRKKQAGKPD